MGDWKERGASRDSRALELVRGDDDIRAVAVTVGGCSVGFFSGTPPDTSRLTITTSLN